MLALCATAKVVEVCPQPGVLIIRKQVPAPQVSRSALAPRRQTLGVVAPAIDLAPKDSGDAFATRSFQAPHGEGSLASSAALG